MLRTSRRIVAPQRCLDKPSVAGWVAHRRDHGGVVFIDLRDSSGLVQVVFRNEDVAAVAHRLRAEYCVAVTGVVEERPEGSENPNLASGRSRSTR